MYIRPGSNRDVRDGQRLGVFLTTSVSGVKLYPIHQWQKVVSDVSILTNHIMNIVL